MTTVLVVLGLLVAGGLFAGWRYVEGQYYVNADGGQVTIYRGVSQPIAWMHFSSVYKRTGVLAAEVPATLDAAHQLGHAGAGPADRDDDPADLDLRPGQQAPAGMERPGIEVPDRARRLQPAASAKTRKRAHKPAPPAGSQPLVPAYCPAQGAG